MNIKEVTEYSLYNYIQYANDRVKALRFLAKLPQEIQALRGEIDWNNSTDDKGNFTLTLYQYDDLDVDLLKMFKMLGFQGLKPKLVYGKTFCAEGEAIIEDTLVQVKILNVPQPENCVLEEYKETVTRYRSKCTQEAIQESIEEFVTPSLSTD
jgi:hypothetical protein